MPLLGVAEVKPFEPSFYSKKQGSTGLKHRHSGVDDVLLALCDEQTRNSTSFPCLLNDNVGDLKCRHI